MARRADGAAYREIRRWLNMRAEHESEGSRINVGNSSFSLLLCVTIRATDETAF
jgi:hypothetical protein